MGFSLQSTLRRGTSCLWAGGTLARVVGLFLALMLLAFTAPAVRGAVLELQSQTGQARLWEDKLPVRVLPAREVSNTGARPMPVVLPAGRLACLGAIAFEAPQAYWGRRPESRGPPHGARAPPSA